MVRVFNPPPGWPKPEEGWTPPPGWKPNPDWPEPPQGWDFWIEKADDVGSSLFGGSALGSSLFETSETSTDSYGSVSPSGAAHIPGAATGPDFNVSNREPQSASDGVSQSSASAPTSPSGPAGPYSGPSGPSGGPGGPSGGPGGPSGGPGGRSGPGGTSGGPGGPTMGAGTMGSGEANTYAASSTPGRSPNSPPPVGPQGGGRMAVTGVLLAIAGVVFTAISYFNAPIGGTYSVYWTPVVFGVILAIIGVVRMIQARAKRQRLGTADTGFDPGGHLTQPGSGTDASGGLQTGQSSTVSMQNPNDPRNYKRR